MRADALVAATPTPSPSPARELDVTAVTPGITGFAFTFALVLAAIGLFMLLTRSLRRAARNARRQGLEVREPARLGRGVVLPVRGPEPTVPGVLDGGSPFQGRDTAPPAEDDGGLPGTDPGRREGGPTP